jgi:hypothetical protein
MHSMFGVLFIFTLRLKDELLEDVIISGDDTDLERTFVSIFISVLRSRYSKPMPTVIYRVSRVRARHESNLSLLATVDESILLLIVLQITCG